jgi:hypothetical protein
MPVSEAHLLKRMGLFVSTKVRGTMTSPKVAGLVCNLIFVLLIAWPVQAQHNVTPHEPESRGSHHASDHDHPAATGWEGSTEGKAYSEFNHHLTGVFVVLIGLSELHHALRITALTWIRLLLPVAMVVTGIFLMIWSDHDAWPIGPRSFSQTFFGGDWEAVQHKLFGILLLIVGSIEWLRRIGRLDQFWWRLPLPAFAIVGGLSLFLHSHGAHPSAHKIAVHHAIMGVMAITAGSSKLVSGRGEAVLGSTSRCRSVWELAWAAFVLLIGIQLLLYTE